MQNRIQSHKNSLTLNKSSNLYAELLSYFELQKQAKFLTPVLWEIYNRLESRLVSIMVQTGAS